MEFGLYLHTLAESLLALGDFAGAENHLRRAVGVYDSSAPHGWLREQQIEEFRRLAQSQLLSATARQGKKEEALAFLKAGLRSGDLDDSVLLDPHLAQLRADHEVQAILETLHRGEKNP